jgi:hypothetical protein
VAVLLLFRFRCELFPLIILGGVLTWASYRITQSTKPNVVVLPPVGPVIFNPAPPTGSNTFLGSITGIPGMYWNVTNQVLDIPSGFVNPNATQSQTTIPIYNTLLPQQSNPYLNS